MPSGHRSTRARPRVRCARHRCLDRHRSRTCNTLRCSYSYSHSHLTTSTCHVHVPGIVGCGRRHCPSIARDVDKPRVAVWLWTMHVGASRGVAPSRDVVWDGEAAVAGAGGTQVTLKLYARWCHPELSQSSTRVTLVRTRCTTRDSPSFPRICTHIDNLVQLTCETPLGCCVSLAWT